MRKIVYSQNVSLDGFIEDRDGKINWTNPGEELHRHFNEVEKGADLHLYGRKMHEIMSAWINIKADDNALDYMKEYAELWAKVSKVVFSKTIREPLYEAELRREVDSEEIMNWKLQEGKNISVGGADLAHTFLEKNLVDEIRLYIYPIILGGGKPMFSELKQKINVNFSLFEKFSNGVILLKYDLKSEF